MKKLLLLLAVCVTCAARAQQSGTPPGNPMPQNVAYTDSTTFSGDRASLALFFGGTRYFKVPTMRQLTDSLQFRVRFTDTATLIETRYHTTHAFQPLLYSGTNIKTINGNSLLGSGDLNIMATLSGTDGSGNMLMPGQTAKPAATAGAIRFYNHNGPSWVAPDGFERSIRWPTVTADRFVSLPDSSGTIALLEKSQSWSGIQTYTTNPVIKSSSPALSLTLPDNTAATISRIPASNNFSVTNTTIAAGNIGKAQVFNGINQWAYATDAGLPSGSGSALAFSLSFWYKGTATTNIPFIYWGVTTSNTVPSTFEYVNTASDSGGMAMFGSTSTVVQAGGVTSFPTQVNNNSWHHVLFTYGANTVKVYIDGILRNSTSAGWSIALKGRLTIGYPVVVPGFGGNNNYLTGSLDQLLIYNRALTTTEVASIYNSGNGTGTPPASGLVRRYDFDTGSTTSTPDLAGSGVALTLVNNPTSDAAGKAPAATGSSFPVNVISSADGQAGADNSVTNLGDPLGQSKLQGQFISTLVNTKNPFTIGKDGHVRIDPAYTEARNTNGSVSPNTNLYLGAGASTISQLQLATSPALTASAGLNGSLIFDGTNFAAVAGGQGKTLAFLESPTFTGIPAAPTAALGTSTTQLATTAFVATALNNLHTGVSSIAGTTDQVNVVNTNGAVTLSLPQNINKTSNLVFNALSLGTNQSDAKLTVNGVIHAKEVKVDTNIPFPDYVFDANYRLKSLDQLKAYIAQYHHLPGVPSAQEVEKEGMKLGELNTALLKKVEELTLYLLEQQKEIGKLKTEVHHLKTGKHKRKNQ